MASNWIKLEVITPDKPEIFRLAEILDIDPDAALGKAIRFWIWTDQQTIDGNAKCNAVSVTKNAIDRVTFMRGFADALIQVGWLVETDGALSIPNFERHNGKSSKNRALTNERVTKSRDSKRKCNAPGVTQTDQKALPEEEEDKYINPTHIARESPLTSWQGDSAPAVVTGQPGDLSYPIGKFPMTAAWQPSSNFRQQAATWGVILPEPGYSPAELASFRDYWISEGRVFTQIQWEQKFARSLQHRPPARPGKTVNDAQVPHWNSPEGWENFI
ncbi:TPA: hypothetical protein PTW02_004283 [Cronobacter sakazakii]|nr:hypothetical protein [Cronobacter sakazakii]